MPWHADSLEMQFNIFNACKKFFWEEEHMGSNEPWFTNIPFSSFQHIFEELGLNYDNENWNFMVELKCIYFTILSKSGESTIDILNMFENIYSY